jgi:hypothetical protein
MLESNAHPTTPSSSSTSPSTTQEVSPVASAYPGSARTSRPEDEGEADDSFAADESSLGQGGTAAFRAKKKPRRSAPYHPQRGAAAGGGAVAAAAKLNTAKTTDVTTDAFDTRRKRSRQNGGGAYADELEFKAASLSVEALRNRVESLPAWTAWFGRVVPVGTWARVLLLMADEEEKDGQELYGQSVNGRRRLESWRSRLSDLARACLVDGVEEERGWRERVTPLIGSIVLDADGEDGAYGGGEEEDVASVAVDAWALACLYLDALRNAIVPPRSILSLLARKISAFHRRRAGLAREQALCAAIDIWCVSISSYCYIWLMES